MENLTGYQISSSTQISTLVKQLASEVHKMNSQIKGPRSPIAAFEKRGAEMMETVGKLRGRPLFYPYIGTGSGNGVYVELEDGSVKLDLINGIGIHLFGHGHPRLIEASIRGALNDIVMQGHLETNKEYYEFNRRLLDIAGKKSRLKHSWITSCGTMANESALKIARQKNTPAKMLLAFSNAFAGRSTMMAELTDNPEYKEGLPSYNEILRLPFYDAKDPSGSTDRTLRAMKEHVAKHEKNICAFSFEMMLGEGGYRNGTHEFFKPLLAFCKEQKIAVWADEIQTFTRTGEMFAFETLGIGEYVDICTIAKTAQCASTLYTEEYNPKPGLIAGTFASSSASLSAGIEVMKMMTEEGYLGPNGKVAQIHKKFVGMLNQLNETSCKGLLTEAGGLGLMIAVTPFDGSKDKTNTLLKTLFKNGLMSFGCGKSPYRIRFLVPAIITDHDIEVARTIIEKSILELK